VRPGSRTKVCVLLVLPQNRHPERSASPIDRVIQRLVARSRRACPERSRRNLGGAYFTHAARSFSTTEARQQDLRWLLLPESLSGFILRKCGLPFLIHRHSFAGRCQVAFSFPSLLCALSVQVTTCLGCFRQTIHRLVILSGAPHRLIA
jgi:hypothetical protein